MNAAFAVAGSALGQHQFRRSFECQRTIAAILKDSNEFY
jgi:hypothetical protein